MIALILVQTVKRDSATTESLTSECWQLASLGVGWITLAGTGSGCRGRSRAARVGRSWGCCRRLLRAGGHGAFGIEQVILAWPQAQTDQSARVGNLLGLPAVVALITAHGVFAGLVPGAGRFSREVMLADQRFLNGAGSIRVNFLLTAHPRGLLPARGVMRCGSCVGRARGFRRAG